MLAGFAVGNAGEGSAVIVLWSGDLGVLGLA